MLSAMILQHARAEARTPEGRARLAAELREAAERLEPRGGADVLSMLDAAASQAAQLARLAGLMAVTIERAETAAERALLS